VSPGDAATPVTKAAGITTVATAAAGRRTVNWAATSANETIGDTQPNDTTCSRGATSSG
jgi:hypothetical protein